MRKRSLFMAALMVLVCSSALLAQNPFTSEFDTPFGVPPFDVIQIEHYLPAFEEGMTLHRGEIEAIVNNPDPPTFENTIEALEAGGAMLTRVSNVFFNMNSANTNDEIQAIAKEVAPKLSKHRDDIIFNEKLFQRVREVYEQRAKLDLTPEQNRVLEDYYKDFARNGANLGPRDKEALAEINKELSIITLSFGENILKENNRFELVIDNESGLSGLPENVRTAAAEAAAERGYKGKWVFTIHKPSMLPFLQYSDRRDLREKIFKAYINQGNNNDDLDNKEILAKIVRLRIERAKMLGYKTHAHFVLEESMAKEPGNVYELLGKIWEPALVRAKEEARDLQAMIDREGGGFKLEPWDWWYYAEKLRREKYALDDELLRPYFEVRNVIQGAFTLANKLYGINFEELPDLPKYHEDVKVFEVKEADGTHIGILYADYYPRASKRGGAWMSAFRSESKLGGKVWHPVITNCGNFSKPTGDTPALLTLDEVLTLFHEFGHALHGLLSEVTYPRVSGTAVALDFVELPSQIMESWVTEPEMLKLYAKHYETGEPMPLELIEKIKKAKHFNQGFATTEYLAASFLDMDWHTLTQAEGIDPLQFENESLNNIGLIPEIIVRYRSPYFRHIFSGGYSSGYYSYVWAEVLDADAFQAFKETSLFDRETAGKFRKYILAAGGSADPMELYRKFRGAEPTIDPLLERRGLK
ncbi:MAG TPA: M3 family metallopeptidase [Patescibacteria group bacterium]|nr:M3 family metallopeptidase [Patescibacteria group bacterium]